MNIFTYSYNDDDILSKVGSYVVTKKSSIVKDYPFVALFNATHNNDAIITRATSYNIFNFSNECVEINNVYDFVCQSFNDAKSKIDLGYVPQYELRPAIIGWILEDDPKDNLTTLSHGGNSSWSFVSGRLILAGNSGSTEYTNKEESVLVRNIPGSLTLFNPNTIATAVGDQDSPMISIDFNVYWYKNGIGDLSILQNIKDINL